MKINNILIQKHLLKDLQNLILKEHQNKDKY